MAIDLPTFRAAFPEFRDAPDPLVQAKLNSALLLVPLVPWGTLQQDAAFYYTARFLAISPFGRKMALVSRTGETAYDAEILRLKRMVTAGYRVT